jgi:dipeptidyl aminopeptidase/acylaminoacyl peptidase
VDRRHVLIGLLGVAGVSTARPSAALAAAINRASAMPTVTQHQISPAGVPPVELFQASPGTVEPTGAILFVHGNQGGRRIGARETVDTGTLLRFCSRLNITAAAVSQPGFGASEGPPDFCGPATQRAISSALSFLRAQPNVDPGRIILYGLSRGAIASAMVATQDNDLRALILTAGVYDLEAAYRTASRGIRRSIEREAGTTSEAFAARSALRHADKIRTETLLLHGRHDDRAPVAQAEQLAKALSDAGVPVSLHVFDCGHRIPPELSRSAMRPLLRKVFGPVAADDREN